jgi:ankyrin repeat protein
MPVAIWAALSANPALRPCGIIIGPEQGSSFAITAQAVMTIRRFVRHWRARAKHAVHHSHSKMSGRITETHVQAVSNKLKQSKSYSKALSRGLGHTMEMPLGAGADVDDLGDVLQVASSLGYEKIVEMLLAKGANVDTGGDDYGSPLQVAAAGGHREVVQMLVEAGAEVNAKGGVNGRTLQAAAVGGHREVVQVLLKAGADVNAQGEYTSALQAAAARGHKEVVQVLLKAGADVNAKGGRYGSALQAAAAGGHKEVVQMLVEAGAQTVSTRLV